VPATDFEMNSGPEIDFSPLEAASIDETRCLRLDFKEYLRSVLDIV
jgi:hypothetical protein